ncbi:MAG: hypothetical protein ACFFCV_09525 [Promethearchaeota archaeon]
MAKETRQRLYNDGVRKECGICHQIKVHNKFSKRQGRLGSICENCRKDLYLTKNLKKKLKIISENYNGECLKCKKNVSILPALEFHHPNPKSKSHSWKSLRVKSYEDTVVLLNNDNVIVLCKNCHILTESNNYNTFKPLILHSSLFLHTLEELNNMINAFIDNNPNITNKLDKNKYYKSKAKYQIKKWIKKRYIIEQFYGGKCIGCENVTVQTNLPSLGFHHVFPSKKKAVIKWDKISRFSIRKISELLKIEKCICLCSNCHSILHSKHFNSNIDDIFGEKYMNLTSSTKFEYNRILRNIENFDIEEKIKRSMIKEII